MMQATSPYQHAIAVTAVFVGGCVEAKSFGGFGGSALTLSKFRQDLYCIVHLRKDALFTLFIP